MLIPFDTHEKLKAGLEQTRDFPTFLLAHYSIEIELTNRFPDAENYIFLCENNESKIWILLKKYPTHKK